jgi:hypothetical protein
VTPPPTPTDVKILVQPTIKIEEDEYLREGRPKSRYLILNSIATDLTRNSRLPG